jgi:hypothetical protein
MAIRKGIARAELLTLTAVGISQLQPVLANHQTASTILDTRQIQGFVPFLQCQTVVVVQPKPAVLLHWLLPRAPIPESRHRCRCPLGPGRHQPATQVSEVKSTVTVITNNKWCPFPESRHNSAQAVCHPSCRNMEPHN